MTDETLGLSPMVVALASGPTCDHEPMAKISMKQKRIFLVIPGRIFRDCVHHLLQAPNQVAVGQIVVGGCDTLDQFDELHDPLDPPDLVIVATGDHVTEGLASIRALRPRLPSTRWIMLSRHGSLNAVYDALELDVEGMLLEDAAGEVLQLVTSLVLLGQSFIPTELARLVYHAKRPEGTSLSRTPGERTSGERASGEKALGDSLRRDPQRRAADHSLLATPPGSPTLWEREEIRFRRDPATKSGMLRTRCQGSLSDREQQILGCLAKGQSNKLIARHLQIAEATVKVHVKALLRKMQVSNRTQAALAAPQFLDVPVLRDKFTGGRGLPIASGADRGVMLPNVERLDAMGHNAAR